MATFQCFDCREVKPVQTDGGTGYAVLSKLNERVCYACAADRDRRDASLGRPIVAYVGKRNARSLNDLTTWAGVKIGSCYLGKSWRVRSHIGPHMYQVYSIIDGVTFTGRSFGEGMCVSLRPCKS